MRNERVEFGERSVVEQPLQAFSGCQLATLVLGIDALLPSAKLRLRTALLKRFQRSLLRRLCAC